jgi:hypothetical protein
MSSNILPNMARELKREVSGWHDVSIRTNQKVCQKKLGMTSHSAAKKPLLTARMVKKRLSFCKKYRSWTAQDWERVMFNDESTFRLVNQWAQKVRRPTLSNRYKQRYVVVNMKHSASVMVCGCFSGNGGRGSLYFLPPQDHHERGQVHGDAQGEADLLNEPPQGNTLPAGWDTMT